MRLIYVDEAGTGPAEPVRVVASVIVDADRQARQIDAAMDEIFDAHVPKHLRKDFHFHGKELFNGGRTIKREEWAFDQRITLFKEILAIPRKFSVPIAVGVTHRGYFDGIFSDEQKIQIDQKKIQSHTIEHGNAFARCLGRSDLFLRKYLKEEEVGVVIAENVDHEKVMLGKMAMMLKHNPITFEPKHLKIPLPGILASDGFETHTDEIACILDVPHFVEKSGARLLQLADACAFTFRRYLQSQPFGADLVQQLLGPYEGTAFLSDSRWFSGIPSGLFNTISYWSDEHHENARQAAMASIITNAIIGDAAFLTTSE